MRRRSFLKLICGAGAAFLVPSIAARQTAPSVLAHLTDPDVWHLIVKPGDGETLWVDGSNILRKVKDGSFEHPYLTLQDAVERSQVGDVIVIWPGYTERFTWPTPS